VRDTGVHKVSGGAVTAGFPVQPVGTGYRRTYSETILTPGTEVPLCGREGAGAAGS
jgi:hypothetical protein